MKGELEYVEISVRMGAIGKPEVIGEAWINTYTGEITDIKMFEENWQNALAPE